MKEICLRGDAKQKLCDIGDNTHKANQDCCEDSQNTLHTKEEKSKSCEAGTVSPEGDSPEGNSTVNTSSFHSAWKRAWKSPLHPNKQKADQA